MEVRSAVRRGDVFLVTLDPGRGQEIRKTRPCVIVSPDEMNGALGTFLVAPLTTGAHPYAFRVPCRFGGRDGHIVVDQVRSIDRDRLVKRLGAVQPATLSRALGILRQMFET